MRIAYLECFAGIAGDMFLGALVQAGVPAEVLREATSALNLGANLKIETVDRSGISSFKVDVLDHGHLAEERPYSHTHVDFKASSDDDRAHQQEGREFEQTQQPRTQHHHRGGHGRTQEDDPTLEQDHRQEHAHGRSLTEIRTLIRAASLKDEVKDLAIRIFELLGHSEAKIHNIPVDSIHFHEVGAVDAIVDIVAASAGIDHLQIGSWYSSPVNVGSGMVECAHGTFPVPAPAVADLLRGFPTYSAHVQKELVTPTGAALLRALNPIFGPQPAMRVSSIGYGAGTRNPANFPNVLRLTLGDADDASEAETVTVLETALDDQSPQLIAYVAEMALSAGALDVMLTPVIMKKGRPGTLLTVLCRPSQSAEFEQMLFRETTTLGIRIRQDRRVILERSHTSVETSYGSIRVKIGLREGEVLNVAPEFEDCRSAAAQHHVSVKLVQQAAIAAYAEGNQR